MADSMNPRRSPLFYTSSFSSHNAKNKQRKHGHSQNLKPRTISRTNPKSHNQRYATPQVKSPSHTNTHRSQLRQPIQRSKQRNRKRPNTVSHGPRTTRRTQQSSRHRRPSQSTYTPLLQRTQNKTKVIPALCQFAISLCEVESQTFQVQ